MRNKVRQSYSIDSLSRRDFCQHASVGFIAAAMCGHFEKLTQAENSFAGNYSTSNHRPKVILILSDDQGYGDISANSHNAAIATPNIDRIAREGVLFTQGYACAAMCTPSRVGMLSGRHPARLGVYDVSGDSMVSFPREEKIAPQYFKELGYATAAIGKWHVGGELDEFKYNHPLNRGFDRFWGFMGATHDYWKADVGSGADTNGRYIECGYNPIFDQHTPVQSMDYLTREISKQGIDFIEANKDRPFFLYLTHHCAHVPLQVPRETYQKYKALGYGDNATTTRAMYDVLDGEIGKLLNKLDELKLTDNTLIIYSSDNGGGEPCSQLNWILRGGKFTLLEGGIRVPMLMRWPGKIPANKIVDFPVSNLDFLPTMAAACGQKPDRKFEGTNLLPFLMEPKEVSPHDALFWKLPPHTGEYAIRYGDWKLVYTSMGRGLFNLRDDISEMKDMRNAHPELVQKLERMYREWDRQNRPSAFTPEIAKTLKRNPSKASADHKYQYSSKCGD
jgi:arylsulfatase A-like enzyme